MMFITKLAMPRRTFLRGLSASIALPLLDSMVPALTAVVKTAAKPTLRLGFVYIPNGANMEMWTPAEAASSFTLSPTLQPLEAFRDRMLVLTGLNALPAEGEGGPHARASATWLSQVPPKRTEGADTRAGTTIDQVVAGRMGETTKLRSLELAIDDVGMVGNCEAGFACTYFNTLSWRTPTTPLPMLTNPRVAFERLFGEGGTAAEMRAQLQQDRSILDSVTSEIAQLQKGLGPDDRRRVSEYLEGIRDIEQRIQRSEAQQSAGTLALSSPPVGVPDVFEEHVKLMFDLQVLAYQADATRVTTFLMSREASGRSFPNLGIVDGHHPLSHHGNDPEKLKKLAKINQYHVSLMSYYLDKLRSTPDGDGSLLDHSMILFGGCISDPNLHSYRNLPTVLFGGAAGQLKGDRHLKYLEGTPLANLFLTMGDKMGIELESFGDSTGRLSDI